MTNNDKHYFRVEPHKPGADGFRKYDAITNIEIPTSENFATIHQKFLDAAAKKKALALRKKIR